MKTLLFTAFTLIVSASAASAQQPTPSPSESRWQPWIGCWQLLDESVADESDVGAEQVAVGASPRSSRSSLGTRVCVAPAFGGVTMTTLVRTERALEETVFADGQAHPINEAACKGTKRSEWSTTGHRLYTTAQIACADQPARNVSSLTMITATGTWVDVQMIDISGRKSIRVRKFRPIDDETQPRTATTVPFVGETSWTLEDIKEASAKLEPETVQAALVELGSGFNLSSKQLIALADAGVPEGVIDLMIALTYPKKFVVSHPVNSAPAPYGNTYGGLGGAWPWIADAEFWPSYYSPFAYRYWGYYDPYHVPSSGYVYVGPSQPGAGGPAGPADPVASGTGRVVDGRGYTRVTTREPAPTIRGDNFGSSGGNNGGMSSGGSSSSGGNSGVSSSGGYSGGGGGDTGRTAVPRPPGGI